jgi:hypothetical protein
MLGAKAGSVRRAAAVSLPLMQRSASLDIALRQRALRGPHFDFVLREFAAQEHCRSQGLDKAVVRRPHVAIELDDKEFVVENVKTSVIAHETPLQSFRDHRSQAELLVRRPPCFDESVNF